MLSASKFPLATSQIEFITKNLTTKYWEDKHSRPGSDCVLGGWWASVTDDHWDMLSTLMVAKLLTPKIVEAENIMFHALRHKRPEFAVKLYKNVAIDSSHVLKTLHNCLITAAGCGNYHKVDPTGEEIMWIATHMPIDLKLMAEIRPTYHKAMALHGRIDLVRDFETACGCPPASLGLADMVATLKNAGISGHKETLVWFLKYYDLDPANVGGLSICREVFPSVCEGGDLDIVEWFAGKCDPKPDATGQKEIAVCASKSGNVLLLLWLIDRFDIEACYLFGQQGSTTVLSGVSNHMATLNRLLFQTRKLPPAASYHLSADVSPPGNTRL
jgi:hypothetical protein